MKQHDDRQAPAAEARRPASPLRPFHDEDGGYRWDAVPVLAYKPDGTHFRGITRQVLFGDAEDVACELRYFEIEAGGHSTLEQHAHVHAVLILRGRGRALVGEAVYDVRAFDLVYVPPGTWHQFRAGDDDPLGFLCLVPCERDRPARPDAAQAAALRAHPAVGAFVRL